MSNDRSCPHHSARQLAEARLSRRRFLRRSAVLGAGVGGLHWAFDAPGVSAAEPAGDKQRTLRFAHITDVHVQPERGAPAGMAAALAHLQGLDDPPEMVLTGGDAIMDALAADAARTDLQWKLWQQVLAADCSLPLEHCLGNHDVWGWDQTASHTSGQEAAWGKQRALDALGLERTYRSFDRGGWHWIVLDSIFPDPATVYIARLDDDQFDWLAEDLARTPLETPVIVISHIPILSVAQIEFAELIAEDPRRARMGAHVDARRIIELFKNHPNVRLCLSGHLHLLERIEYAGVTYLCSGAVSGYWWKGDHATTDEGYSLVDLYNDGTFAHHYVPYGWQVQG